MNNNNTHDLFNKLDKFIKKYYQNQLIKGGIYVLSTLIIFFIFFAIVEYFFLFDVLGRTFLFWSYILLNLIIFVKLFIIPLLRLFNFGKTLNHKEASKIIGKHFSEINDKLINTLELSELSKEQNALVEASIHQKTKELTPISFKKAIDFSLNKKRLKWILMPVFIIILFFISGKDYVLTKSSARIIQHNTFFEPEAPFKYVLLNSEMACKQYDDFLLKVAVTGNEIPKEIFIHWGKNTFKMKNLKKNEFEHQFFRVHSDINFHFSAGGYESKNYLIKSLLQPKVVSIEIDVIPPKYTNKERETINNTGDIIVSEGSVIKWSIKLENSNNCSFMFENKQIKNTTQKKLNVQQKVFNKTSYSIISSNDNNLSDSISYSISVIKDEFPKINLTQSYDSLNNRHLFSGVIEDDYLVSKLEFICSYSNNDSAIISTEEISIKQKNIEQFFHSANFEELNIDPGSEVNYYFKVWDNDGVNGQKFTNSKSFFYAEPSLEKLIEKKDLQNLKTKSGLKQSIMLAEEIQKEIKILNKKILENKNIGWEEKKKAKDILKKQKELERNIAHTQKNNSKNLKLQEKINPSVLQKQKQLEELMNKVLNEEIKKILEEIEKMMDKAEKEKLKDLLEKLDKENSSLEKELDRELELFKQIEFEQKVEETIEKIDNLTQEQKKLKKKTKENTNNKNNLTQEQDALSKKMNEIKKDLENLRQKNMQLKNKNELPKTQQIEEDIKQKMKKSHDALQKGMQKQSIKSQQQSIESLKKLKEKLQSMQQESANEKPVEDMESLRKILENLVKLSFDQEDLITKVKNTPKNSPEFITIVRKQNKLADDSKIIEDSLFALSKRVIQIEATINQEITSIKSNMKKATKELEARAAERATERQQLVMTATNNLALLLSEILEQMQKQLDMPSSQCNKPRNCNKPNPNCKKPSMSEIRKAQKKLNGKMKNGNKKEKGENKGRKMGEKQSKELINLAKQQEEIRKQLLELRDEIGKNGEKGKIDKILDNMKENERDIINNRITQETINRQKEILTRLLKAENSDREQEKDNKRESIEWRMNSNDVSQEYLNYKQKKTAQEELLKTTPLQLTPFYKKKVASYFKNIIND